VQVDVEWSAAAAETSEAAMNLAIVGEGGAEEDSEGRICKPVRSPAGTGGAIGGGGGAAARRGIRIRVQSASASASKAAT